MAISKKAQFGSIWPLIDDSKTVKDDSSIFHTYKPKREIGKEIFKELYKRFNNDPSKGQCGFFMDDSGEVGILSQCQSLQALLLLASDFDLTFDERHIASDTDENLTIREIMDLVIEDVLKRISTKTPDVYRFDATPYESKAFTVDYSNIEAITWVIPCFLQALKYHARIGEKCKFQERLVSVVSYGLRYLNDSFISSKSELGTSDRLEIGWNFTKDCEEPSLYYTFAVCECYVDFFSTFDEYLTYEEAVRKNELYDIAIPKKLSQAHKRHLDDYAKHEKITDIELTEEGRERARFDEYNELFCRYREINTCDKEKNEGIDGTLYGEFEQKCKSVAAEIWRLTKNGLADNFYYNDLHTALSEDDIFMATTSDALFNTVYIINIMLDVGLDEDIQLRQDIANSPEEVDRARRDYSNLFDSCQLASQKAFRTYEKLKEEGKEYIVEQFLVGFNENFTVHKELVKDLRKKRMRVFTLMPMLIRTNNVISEYLIKYPQVNMKKYLGYILENRYKDKWIWESDGFFSASNYYYVSALGEFYSYYASYESKFIENYNENERQRTAIIAERDEELNSPSGEIGKLKRQLRESEARVRELNSKLNNVSKPVEDAVAGVVLSETERLLPDMLCSLIEDTAAGLTASLIDPTPLSDEQSRLEKAVKSLAFSMLSQMLYDEARIGKATDEEKRQSYIDNSKFIKKDIRRILMSYIAEIVCSSDDDKRSSFYNN